MAFAVRFDAEAAADYPAAVRFSVVLLMPSLALGLGACRRTHPPPAWQPSLGHSPVAAPVEAPPPPSPPRYSPPPPAPIPTAIADAPDSGAMVVLHTGPDGGTANGDPRGPRAEALNAIVKGAAPGFQRCFDADDKLPDNTDLTATVTYRIEPKGKAVDVAVNAKLPPAVSKCLASVVENLKFPEFQGPDINGAVPVTYRRDVGAPPRR